MIANNQFARYLHSLILSLRSGGGAAAKSIFRYFIFVHFSLSHTKGTCRFIKRVRGGAISIIFRQGLESFHLIFDWKCFWEFSTPLFVNPRMHFVNHYNSGVFSSSLKTLWKAFEGENSKHANLLSRIYINIIVYALILYSQLHVH